MAQKKMKAKRIEYVPGVGVDLQKFDAVSQEGTNKREELGIPKDAMLLLSSDLAVMGQYNQKKTEDFSSHNVYATVRNIYGVETNG